MYLRRELDEAGSAVVGSICSPLGHKLINQYINSIADKRRSPTDHYLFNQYASRVHPPVAIRADSGADLSSGFRHPYGSRPGPSVCHPVLFAHDRLQRASRVLVDVEFVLQG